jgi:hypothetical protein
VPRVLSCWPCRQMHKQQQGGASAAGQLRHSSTGSRTRSRSRRARSRRMCCVQTQR